jgi:hypothetical protein
MTIGPPFPRNVPVSKGRLAVNHPTMGRFSIPFQYNPDKVTRSLSLQATGIAGGLRSKARVPRRGDRNDHIAGPVRGTAAHDQ